MKMRKRATRLITSLGLLLVLLPPLYGQLPEAPSPALTGSRDQYVGDAACGDCHQAESHSYLGSAHHVASRPPDATSIDGKFTPGSNILRTSNPYFYFVMNATAEGYFQRAVARFPPSDTITHKERIDLVIGSGRKGQTYLYWKSSELFELPVSYWSETGQWMNSPGYPDGLPNFDKPIIPRCLECHATYIESLPPPLNHFEKSSVVLGITCEKCHGAGKMHVEAERSHKVTSPGTAANIVNPAKLSRDQQIDLCALCHAGPGNLKAPAFSFVPGATLAKFVAIPDDPADTPVDVHGHQVQLLESSRCFRSSSMTCTTCHDVHKQQQDLAYFSERCLTCHKAESCGRYATMGDGILHKCVDCHMPLRESNVISLDAGGHSVKPQVRSHRIAVY
jgi:ssDNA-binding Zn-finger/Zn-ribbon topoisomerase 1